ncbi:RING finger and CHY zinc finger domain-containing protein [Spironucleus salmonicida]|uniref:RING finger and CHY zinc finger domain-containing protein n=1 Tax=Spironucleus salmonicida TaxID=348837 RepID=V6LM27_9EUKA|nr:RING finger and CHY zinc finger domain-containing protein [Spironucleus salmonicida]|eukprot:EST45273.1 RING finger and CHY zinc finger domain-containing protein [Spironucleus salmonicida]
MTLHPLLIPTHAKQIQNCQTTSQTYLNALAVRPAYQIEAIEVVYFLEINGRKHLTQAAVITPVGDNSAFWARETQKLFKICSLQTYSQDLKPYEMRRISHLQNYKQLLQSSNYFGYFFKYYSRPVTGCLHQISGCSYNCATCNRFHICVNCHNDISPEHPVKYTLQIKCLFCDFIQHFASTCVNCKQKFGNYCCDICQVNTHETDFSTSLFHCTKCNSCHQIDFEFCEICHQCNNDMEHICGSDQVCVVCFEKMSNDQVQSDCKHFMCYKCYRLKISENDVKCPICKKTFLLEQDLIGFKVKFQEIYSSMYNTNSGLIKNQCNDCGKVIYQKENIIQYCKSCNFYNVEKLYHMDQMEKEHLFEPNLKSMKQYLLDVYSDEIRSKFNLKGANERKLISEIYKFLGISADNQTACKMMQVVKAGMRLEQIRVELKIRRNSKK